MIYQERQQSRDFPTVIVTGKANERYRYVDMYEKGRDGWVDKKLVRSNRSTGVYERSNGITETYIYVSVQQILHCGLDAQTAYEIYITDTGMNVLLQYGKVQEVFNILAGVRASWYAQGE